MREDAAHPQCSAETHSGLSATLSDGLISLAQEAERCGLMATADRLVRLACDLFDEPKFKSGVDAFTASIGIARHDHSSQLRMAGESNAQ